MAIDADFRLYHGLGRPGLKYVMRRVGLPDVYPLGGISRHHVDQVGTDSPDSFLYPRLCQICCPRGGTVGCIELPFGAPASESANLVRYMTRIEPLAGRKQQE
jgi:hypothetical protein